MRGTYYRKVEPGLYEYGWLKPQHHILGGYVGYTIRVLEYIPRYVHDHVGFGSYEEAKSFMEEERQI